MLEKPLDSIIEAFKLSCDEVAAPVDRPCNCMAIIALRAQPLHLCAGAFVLVNLGLE